jgi:hypothetical protein
MVVGVRLPGFWALAGGALASPPLPFEPGASQPVSGNASVPANTRQPILFMSAHPCANAIEVCRCNSGDGACGLFRVSLEVPTPFMQSIDVVGESPPLGVIVCPVVAPGRPLPSSFPRRWESSFSDLWFRVSFADAL